MRLIAITVALLGMVFAADPQPEDMPKLSSMLDTATLMTVLGACTQIVFGCIQDENIDLASLQPGGPPMESEKIIKLVNCALERAYGDESGDSDGCIATLESTDIGAMGAKCQPQLNSCDDQEEEDVMWCVYTFAKLQAEDPEEDMEQAKECKTEALKVAGFEVGPDLETGTCGQFSPEATGSNVLCADPDNALMTYNPAMDDETCSIAVEGDDPELCINKCCCRKKWYMGTCLSYSRRKPNNIGKCYITMELGDKCEADSSLPDGDGDKWNTNHCPGGFEIFIVQCMK